jgi:hypothetical protein
MNPSKSTRSVRHTLHSWSRVRVGNTFHDSAHVLGSALVALDGGRVDIAAFALKRAPVFQL